MNPQQAILTENLGKSYKIFKRSPGLFSLMRSIFHREYEEVPAISGLCFEIKYGEFVGLIGPNGAGKTTMLKLLSGILYPSNGTVCVLGYNPFDKNEVFLKKISLVSAQKEQLWWDLPALDSFEMIRVFYDVKKNIFTRRIHAYAEMLQVDDCLDIQIRTLSLGQRMKVELIGAILHSPEILFLDEPTVGLDFIHKL